MKYKKSTINFSTGIADIIVTSNENNLVSFDAQIENPNYAAFLEQAKLTDSEVQALTPDTWYDFPKENA